MRVLPKRVDRLIGISVFAMVAIVWFVLVGFDTLNTFLNRLGDLSGGGLDMRGLLGYLVFTTPKRLYDWFANAALIGALLGLGGLATTGELTALRAAGLSKLRISLSVLASLCLLLVIVMLMGETLAPYATHKAHDIELRGHASSTLHLTTSSGLWSRDGNKIINAKQVISTSNQHNNGVELADVRIFTLADNGDLQTFEHAKRAIHKADGWQLEKNRISRVSDSAIKTKTRRSMPWKTSLDASLLKQSAARPDELSMRDLYRNMRYLANNNQSTVTYAKAFWEHVLFPVNVLVLVICALPFCFGALRSGGLGKRIFIGVVLALGWHFLQQGVSNAGIVYGLTPWLADLLPAMVLLVLASLYFRRA